MNTLSKIIITAGCAILFATGGFARPKAVKKEMAVQLYSVKDLIGNADRYAQNHKRVLKAIAEMGYTAVEAACYNDGLLYGVTPEQFKADIEEAGMKVLSTDISRKKNLHQEISRKVSNGGTQQLQLTRLPEWNT